MNDSKKNLGGFPPIIFINTETKKRREFEKKINENIDKSTYKQLNILKLPNMKNILSGKNK